MLKSAFASLVFCFSLYAEMGYAYDVHVSFCNRTPEAVYVAVGADRADTGTLTSWGWNNVGPCTCETVLNRNLLATEIYLLAARAGLENVLSGEQAGFCVHPSDSFTFTWQNADPSSCTQGGGEWAIFKRSDTAPDLDHRVNLTRQGSCNLIDDQ